MKQGLIRTMATMLTAASLLFAMTACGKGDQSYKDGQYEGTYVSDSEHPSTFDVKITIKDQRITEVTATEKDENGKIKDQDYGKGLSDMNYKLCQQSVEGFKKYPGMLIEKQKIDEVDAVTGATQSLKGFKEAVKDALSKAH